MCLFIETIRIEGGRIHNLPYHNARMNRTRAEVFGQVAPLDLAEFIEPAPYQGRTKCRVEYAEHVRGIDYTPYRIRVMRSLRMVVSDTAEYRHKRADRAFLDDLFRSRGDSDDILIVREGLLTDTYICNIALGDGQSWVTPARPLLAGTARASLLDAGTIRAEDIPAEDVYTYPRIRLFNALIGFGELEIRTGCIFPYG